MSQALDATGRRHQHIVQLTLQLSDIIGTAVGQAAAHTTHNIGNDLLLILPIRYLCGYTLRCFPLGHAAMIVVLDFPARHPPVNFIFDLGACFISTGEHLSRRRTGTRQNAAHHREIGAKSECLDNIPR